MGGGGGLGAVKEGSKGVRNDERVAAEPALATQSLTGLFIVQWDASSLSHNSFFFPFLLFVCIFWGRERGSQCA